MAQETVTISGKGDTSRLRRILEEHGYKVRESAGRRENDLHVDQCETATDGDDAIPCDEEWLESLMADHEAYERKLPELMEQYEGQFVAFYQGEVIGVGDTAKEAARHGIEHLGRPEALMVAKVGEPIPEPVDTGMRFDRPYRVVIEE